MDKSCAVNLTEEVKILPELQKQRPPVYVCPSCGFLSNERLIFCAQCGKRLQGIDDPRVVDDPARERRRVKLLYAWLSVWVLLLGGAVLFTVGYDPTAGHVGHVVYGDEFLLESAGREASMRLIPGGQTFRLSRNDRVEKMTNLPTRSPRNVWIRITNGPHAGRSGVIVW